MCGTHTHQLVTEVKDIDNSMSHQILLENRLLIYDKHFLTYTRKQLNYGIMLLGYTNTAAATATKYTILNHTLEDSIFLVVSSIFFLIIIFCLMFLMCMSAIMVALWCEVFSML